MPASSPPVVLSRPIIPFSSDELQNENRLLSNYKFQLTDFGTGEQWLLSNDYQASFTARRSDLGFLFSGDGQRVSCGSHPTLRVARSRGHPGQKLGYQRRYLEFGLLGE
jgi:hypothetical protein